VGGRASNPRADRFRFTSNCGHRRPKPARQRCARSGSVFNERALVGGGGDEFVLRFRPAASYLLGVVGRATGLTPEEILEGAGPGRAKIASAPLAGRQACERRDGGFLIGGEADALHHGVADQIDLDPLAAEVLEVAARNPRI
jgi:hypothetical protein